MNRRLLLGFRSACGVVVLLVTGLCAKPATAAERDVDVLIWFDHAPNNLDEQLLNQFGGKLKRQYRNFPVVAAKVPGWTVAGLSMFQGILKLEPDREVTLNADELAATWGVDRIGSGDAFALGQTGAGVKVAVIDTGIDYTHADLFGRYAGGYDFVNNDADPFDDHGHGTHVSGTIAAVADGKGVVGVAPDVQIYALKVLGADGSGSYSGVIAAVDWCITHGIQITNNSYGSSSYPGTLVEAAFISAAQAGILHIGSAGNSGNSDGTGNTVGYPGGFDSVVAVAATGYDENRAYFSSTGPQVELAAPGVSIPSTLPGGNYAYWSGTSMASPHVAGAAAVLLGAGVFDSNNDGLLNDDVRALLHVTALDLGASGRDEWYGYGRIDVALALTLTKTASSAPQVPQAVDPPPLVMTVDSVTYRQRGPRNRHLVVWVSVVDENGAPVENATVTIKLKNHRTNRFIFRTSVTNAYGRARFLVKNAPKGRWSTRVNQVIAEGYEWDGAYPLTSYFKR